MDLLELAAQQPLQVRIDHGQRLVEQDGRHVLRTSPRPSEIRCLASAVSPRALRPQLAGELEQLGDFLDPRAASASPTPRLRSGKARLSNTVMVS